MVTGLQPQQQQQQLAHDVKWKLSLSPTVSNLWGRVNNISILHYRLNVLHIWSMFVYTIVSVFAARSTCLYTAPTCCTSIACCVSTILRSTNERQIVYKYNPTRVSRPSSHTYGGRTVDQVSIDRPPTGGGAWPPWIRHWRLVQRLSISRVSSLAVCEYLPAPLHKRSSKIASSCQMTSHCCQSVDDDVNVEHQHHQLWRTAEAHTPLTQSLILHRG